ncbi:hypothetical protein LAZ67_19001650, partial [Cordylochernes scorpioides]
MDVLPFATTRITRCPRNPGNQPHRADINPDHKDVIPHQGKDQHNVRLFFNLSIFTFNVKFLVDTGSTINLISFDYLHKILPSDIFRNITKYSVNKHSRINTLSGPIQPIFYVILPVSFFKRKVSLKFYIFNLPYEIALIGLYTLKKLKTRIDFNRNVVSQQGTNIPATLFYFETDLAYVNDAYNVINPDRKYNINQHLHIVNTQILDNHCAPSGSNPLYVNHLQQTLSTQSSIPGENKLTSDLIDKYHKINNLLDLKLIRLLKEFAEIFPTDPFKVPTLHIQPVQIKPNTDRVIRLRPYRIPFTYRKEIDIQINEMLKNNIIEPAIGEYASPITLVKKKNGTFRMCVDFRKLNEHIPVDPQPIPLIESVIEKLSKDKYFSSLDLSNAYWTVPIHPDSRPYLAFTTHAGVYMFKRLPFGLRSSPQIFERAIGQILRKYNFQFLEHYYDDFIIFSDSFEEHLEHLRLFFQLCRAENIRLNLNKCQLCKTSISFLGYEITQGTYKPHLTNTQVIGTIQPPTNVKTLQSFLGVVNVYHKFIPHYAQLRSPLNILLKKNIPFKWTLECQKAFEDLKSSLTASPVLHIFKEDLPCFLYCDASTLGISGILKQKDENGEEHPVQYFSRSLRKYEQNYSISELECLAIIESIEYFRVYLLGRHFTIYSDHQALVYLKNIKNPSGRLFRWSLRLSPYTFDIHYLKGKKQLEADLLSRQPFCGFLEAQQLEEHQHRVPEKYQSLINTDGLAIITKKGVPRVVVPDTLRNKLLQKAHEWYNHPGITQLTRLITSQYYWDGMTKDINNYVRKCKICQIIKPPKGPSYGEMGTLPLAKEPYELLSMDTVAGFTKYGGNRAYLHVICDHMSRYCWTFPSKSTSTLTYIQILKRVFQEGIPKNLLTDRAPAFTSAQFRRFLISQGIKPLYTTANHPQSNGLSERLNATITGKLKILHLEHPKQTWTKQIERVTRIYNLTPHTVTGFPPIYLLKGIVPNNLNNHVQTFPELSEARRIALQKTQARHKAEKLMYDQKHKKIDFVPGDLVLVKVYRHPNTPKLEPNYTGPYEILEILSPQVVRINRPNRPLQLQTEIINIEKLRRYVENIPHITPPTDLPDSPPRQNYFLFPYRHFTTDILGDPGPSRPRKWFQPFNHLDNSIFTDEKFYKPDFPITSKPTFSPIVKPTKSSTLVLDPKINPFDNMVESMEKTAYLENVKSHVNGSMRKTPTSNITRPNVGIMKANHDVKHFIITKGPPVFSRARQLDPKRLNEAKQEFQFMLEHEIIRPSKSQWASPLHLVTKKDGTLRPCGDYRKLNSQTLPDRYPIPRLEDFQHILSGKIIFSRLDLFKAYYQIPIAEEDKPKTAIITPFGLYEFNVMSFGLRNAPATFQRFIHEVLRGLDFTFPYLDDILVASETCEEHETHLKLVFEKLQSYGLRINIAKSILGVDQLEFLGHWITNGGSQPLPSKVQTILDYKLPTTKRELRTFLGMVNFYRRYLENAASTQALLHDYLKDSKKNDKRKIDWSEEAKLQFERCKQDLASAALLCYPNPALPLSLCTDASNNAIGSVLQQCENRCWKPIAFFSKKSNNAQKNREVKISIDRLKPAYILRTLDQPASSGDPIIPASREDPIIPASREDPIIPASREDPIIPASREDPIGPSSKPQPSKPGVRFELPKETRSGRRIKTPSRGGGNEYCDTRKRKKELVKKISPKTSKSSFETESNCDDETGNQQAVPSGPSGETTDHRPI